MTIKLNGQTKETNSQTVAELLDELQAPQTGVAVALNGAVVLSTNSVLIDSTPLVRVDSPEAGWTSRFLVPARGNLRTPEESGSAPRLAMVHHAGGDRNQVTVLRWTGGSYVGASAT